MYTIVDNTRLIYLATTLLISGSALLCGSADACDEEAAVAAGKSGDYELVFKILKPCESDPKASANVLFTLAYFISEGRYDPAVVDACLNLPPDDADE